MASGNKLVAIGVIAFISFGAGMALYGYQQAIYPIDTALGYLARAETAQTPEDLADYVAKAQRAMPETGNPVWSFPTARTDFALIQDELDRIMLRANSISSLETYSTEYNTGMTDMHASLRALQEDLIEAMPYMYASFTNIMISSVWIGIVLMVILVMRRGKSKYREQQYESQ
ncbi:MAG TPA: hypothetical protein VJP79_10590 [Nitrososphaera sp.]|nr:hypothetical protein [Nitrososphaera sp.]